MAIDGEVLQPETIGDKPAHPNVAKNWFKPGNKLGGRPKGSRHKLGEAFIEAMHNDFNENGAEAIQKVRQERPQDYLKVIAAIIPKDFTFDGQDPLVALFEHLQEPVFPEHELLTDGDDD